MKDFVIKALISYSKTLKKININGQIIQLLKIYKKKIIEESNNKLEDNAINNLINSIIFLII